MYKLFAVLLMSNFALGHYGHEDSSSDESDSGSCEGHDSGPWSGEHHHSGERHKKETDFEKLARLVISSGKLLRNICKQSKFSRTKMMAGQDFYSLKYNLGEYSEQNFTVKIQHRVIQVTADSPGKETFKDLRILPDFVNVANANWYFDNGVLLVLIPYKNALKTEVALGCDNVNETIISVPKTINSENDLRFLGNI
ncbi:uncharacterized protein [Battus philenor]|uniref:uncharacterized protein n=1 Tax=Battus philenor TaxID=42288 RepID=UPI0035CE9E01